MDRWIRVSLSISLIARVRRKVVDLKLSSDVYYPSIDGFVIAALQNYVEAIPSLPPPDMGRKWGSQSIWLFLPTKLVVPSYTIEKALEQYLANADFLHF